MHPEKNRLERYAMEGCLVDCGEDWLTKQIKTALQHGPHKSTKSKEAAAFIHAETEEKQANGFARVVTYGKIKQQQPAKLKYCQWHASHTKVKHSGSC
eukprot:3368058-Ditylum_brightwellii.AAC.1